MVWRESAATCCLVRASVRARARAQLCARAPKGPGHNGNTACLPLQLPPLSRTGTALVVDSVLQMYNGTQVSLAPAVPCHAGAGVARATRSSGGGEAAEGQHAKPGAPCWLARAGMRSHGCTGMRSHGCMRTRRGHSNGKTAERSSGACVRAPATPAPCRAGSQKQLTGSSPCPQTVPRCWAVGDR